MINLTPISLAFGSGQRVERASPPRMLTYVIKYDKTVASRGHAHWARYNNQTRPLGCNQTRSQPVIKAAKTKLLGNEVLLGMVFRSLRTGQLAFLQQRVGRLTGFLRSSRSRHNVSLWVQAINRTHKISISFHTYYGSTWKPLGLLCHLVDPKSVLKPRAPPFHCHTALSLDSESFVNNERTSKTARGLLPDALPVKIQGLSSFGVP